MKRSSKSKRIQFAFIMFTVACAFDCLGQTIRIADNNVYAPTGPNIYSSLQGAIDSAFPGDIIYIQPSSILYAGVTVTKKLTIIGAGFGAGIVGGKASTVGDLYVNANDVVLKSFTFNNMYWYSMDNLTLTNMVGHSISTNGPISNLTVNNSSFFELLSYTGPAGTFNNVKIYDNSIGGAISAAGISNAVISNNIFHSDGVALDLNTTGNVVMTNNLFTGSGVTFANLQNATVNNNIFYGKQPSNTTSPYFYFTLFAGNSFNNNLSLTNSAFPPASGGAANTGTGNIVNSNPNFVNATPSSSEHMEFDFALGASSPAKNAGSDGTDIGPTGGNVAYRIVNNVVVYVPSSIPVITDFNTSGVIPQNQPLKANVKAKSN